MKDKDKELEKIYKKEKEKEKEKKKSDSIQIESKSRSISSPPNIIVDKIDNSNSNSNNNNNSINNNISTLSNSFDNNLNVQPKERRPSSPLAFLSSLSPSTRKKKKKEGFKDLNDLSLNTLSTSPPKNDHHHHHHHHQHRKSSIDSDDQQQNENYLNRPWLEPTKFIKGESININQLPHTVLLKILHYLIQHKIDTEKSEIRFEQRSPTEEGGQNLNLSGQGIETSSPLSSSLSSTNHLGGKKISPNYELESISLVCKLWGMELAPQIFKFFIVKSPKHLKALIRLTSQGLLEGGRRFEFLYIAMILDKSSTFQKFMNIVKHTMPDKVPEKFLKATTKPILSNTFSKHLFTSFFDTCKTMKYFRFYQKWVSPENFTAIGNALRTNHSVTHISFRHNNLEDPFVEDIINALYENNTIEALDFRGNKLGNQSAIKLAGALLRNHTLKIIDLFYNNIESEGGVALCNALKINKSLKKLYLRWNHIDSQTAVVLSDALKQNTTLDSFHLDRILDHGGAALFDAIRQNHSVTEINLSDCSLKDGSAIAISKAFIENSTLKDINFKSNLLGSSINLISKALVSNKVLTRLNLSDNRIGDSLGRDLGEAFLTNESIKSLSLSLNHLGNLFSERMAKSLLINNTLEMLDISGNQIDFEGAKHWAETIATNKTLKLLNLSQNSLSPKFGIVIADALKSNKTLIHLELAYSNLGDEGAIQIANVLASNSTHIRRLNMSENHIKDSGGIAFAQAISTNEFLTDLDLSYNNFNYKTREIFDKNTKSNSYILNISYSQVPLRWKFQL
ncbi:hypothetical protein CYY_005986 [Polysphondylium violaceum]|uniref:Leucine-rich repeat-containing protein n=1 Tax=Polysphondylium violaceum TaxID=133409 RepID=A0A8J4URT5_9MYCE|nr:hypothetical protein CYY_005986 [Polysphondylium violaceum]